MTNRELRREARLEATVAILREKHGTCPPGIPSFTCNLRRIDETEIDLVLRAWKDTQ